MWTLDSIELNGGFLPGLKLTLPHGLICIIGPREAQVDAGRGAAVAIKGTVGASKPRLDLLQANIGGSGLVNPGGKNGNGCNVHHQTRLQAGSGTPVG